jgi:hypothetical protein
MAVAKGGMMMAIRLVTPDGFEFTCDSAQEAVAMYGMISKVATSSGPSHRLSVRSVPISQTNGVASRKEALTLADLPDAPQRIARALIEHPNGLTSDRLGENSGIETTKLPPIIRGLRAALVNAGLCDPLMRDKFFEGGRPKSKYHFSKEVIARLSQK